MNSSTVFVVDDDDAVRRTLGLVIRSHGMQAQTFDSSEAFLAATDPQQHGCVIIDWRLPGGMDGLQLLHEMNLRGYRMPAIMLTAHGDIRTAVQATKCGAVDFLLKPIRNDDLMRSVQEAMTAANGSAPPASTADIATTLPTRLTPREREIVELAIAGKSSKEIGRILGISNRTVDVHRGHILEKTGARSIFDIARAVWSER